MLYPNLFLRKIAKDMVDEMKVPTITAQRLSGLELFPDVEERWTLRERLTGQASVAAENRDERVGMMEWDELSLPESLEDLMSYAQTERDIMIRKIGLTGKGVYRMSWGPTARLIQYSPPDDACVVWHPDMKAIGFYSDVFIHEGELEEYEDWGCGEMVLFLTLDESKQWQKVHIKLSTRLWGDSERTDALDTLLEAQVNWTEGRLDVAVNRLEKGKADLAKFCVIPRTAGFVQALEMPLTEPDVQKVCVLLGLDADTTERFKQHWRACSEKGEMGLVTGGESIAVAIECEFAAVIERSKPKAPWTFDYTMNRKDVGRAAVRQYQHQVVDPKEGVVDKEALQSIVDKLLDAISQLNRDDLWQVAERKLRELYGELGLEY